MYDMGSSTCFHLEKGGGEGGKGGLKGGGGGGGEGGLKGGGEGGKEG